MRANTPASVLPLALVGMAIPIDDVNPLVPN
jgi:hypothetical protein